MGPHKKHKRASTSSDNSDNDDDSRKRNKKKHKHSKKKRLKKNKHVTSSSESSTSTDSEEERRKERKKLKKQKKLDKKSAKEKTEGMSTDIPLELMEKSKTMAPMTKEEWEKRQSVVRKVYDETTGRHRLIKGDGEVIEEIVSRDRHKAINQQATKGDGAYFQTQISKNIV